ncbi:MAG TPA: phosphate ABC transporter substrate-binding protein PstS, partial [Actinomycetes bacterium]|nr:phosphate ABC transporter substrate-binding protein PstS [Actinomycetes bacterium]
MTRHHRPRRVATGVAAAFTVSWLAVSGVPAVAQPQPGAGPGQLAAAQQYVQISGAGSTWSYNAIDNWRRNIQQFGIVVNYAATGSTDGRNQFKNGTVDFGVSEIPYGQRDSFVVGDQPPGRNYAYMPIVAGGTAFMYNLKINGRRVTNLRLSGEVISKIFTGVLKRWNDPAIKVDNPGLQLPARTIVPVVRSDGSGTTAQFTLWMSKQHSALWNNYCRRLGRPTPCGLTSFFQFRAADGFIGQSGSNGVSGYVAQNNAEGAITYVEYSYALNQRFPVVKVLNRAGYYTEPTAPNVAVALLRAQINNNSGSAEYLTQKLDRVYSNSDPRTYPLSSYSYMILPTSTEQGFTNDKGRTLGAFGYYFLCEGQQQADVLGYSPLPINLVKAGLRQVKRIPGVDVRSVNIAGCNNPTFSRNGSNTLARNAPQPSACDRRGPVQGTAGTGGARQETPVLASARCVPGATGGQGGGGGPTGGSSGGPTGGSSGGPSTGPSGSASPTGLAIDPDTGEVLGSTEGVEGEQVDAQPVSLAAEHGWGIRHTLMLLA